MEHNYSLVNTNLCSTLSHITENSKLQQLQPKVDSLESKNKNLNEELDVIKTALQGRIHRDNEKARYALSLHIIFFSFLMFVTAGIF